ncbi:MAG: ABC transporter permease [Anaerolineales bacterium]|nr:ABC transporter permease [Anaerolineales bacterium]QYK50716.1 MAG: ABC transporter permease [Anaerolineales bacterium]
MANQDSQSTPPKDKSAFGIFMHELARGSLIVPILAIITGLLLGGLIVAVTTDQVYTAWSRSPLEAIGVGINAALRSYSALFNGAIGNPERIADALASGEAAALRRAFNPFFESLIKSVPYIFAGLAVALGFRAGLFNIGAEGQLFMGAVASVYVGFAVKGLPAIIHLPLALGAGALGGAIWGFIPGWLKAKTGGHEVINTIMMNYIAFRLSEYLLRGPLQRPDTTNPISPFIETTAQLPRFFESPIRFHLGFFIALAAAYGVYWLLFKTRLGFELRTVGANPNAARYAGMNILVITVLAMSLSGALAGMAGANEVLGVNYTLAPAFSSGYGFDSIALALIGRSHPVGVVLAALLFGTLRNGALQMQIAANVPVDIISVMQALILAFIAAPAIIRTIYRLRAPQQQEDGLHVRGWGG